MTARLLLGNSLEVLPTLESGSVHCVVTSPPYLGLRDYQIPPTVWPAVDFRPMVYLPPVPIPEMTCVHGLEPDPLSYVGHEVLIFREVWRVLRNDGLIFLNLGDTYSAGKNRPDDVCAGGMWRNPKSSFRRDRRPVGDTPHKGAPGLKPKNLMGIPWMVALRFRQMGGFFVRTIFSTS